MIKYDLEGSFFKLENKVRQGLHTDLVINDPIQITMEILIARNYLINLKKEPEVSFKRGARIWILMTLNNSKCPLK